MNMNQYRLVDHGSDGWSHFQFLCCKGRVSTCSYSIENWKFCPLCGSAVAGKYECRPHGTPRWAWDRGIEDWWSRYNKEPERRYWEVQSRYARTGRDLELLGESSWSRDCDAFWLRGKGDREVERAIASLREVVAYHQMEENAPMFWETVEEFRLVLRDSNRVYATYRPIWAYAKPVHCPDDEI